MDPSMIIGGLLAAGASGLGIGVGARLVPTIRQAGRDLRQFKRSEEGLAERRITESKRGRRAMEDHPGRRRDSSVVGLYGDVLRRQDGSYTRVYDFPLQPTFYAHEEVSEQFCDRVGRLLAVPKPANTVMQYRYEVAPDPGRAVAAHLRSRSYDHIHLPAARLHDNNVDFYKALADARAFRAENASFNVTVPAKHDDDRGGQGFGAFAPALREEIKQLGLGNFARAFTRARAKTLTDGVVRRLVAAEREAYGRAEKVFRFVEMQSPAPLRRLGRGQLWEAVFRSHCPNHPAVPLLGDVPGFDVRDYLCAESIEGGGWYVLHGRTPVAMVSMMRPGDPQMFATSMRALTADPELVFRHTLVAEFVYLDKRQAVKALDRRVRAVKRTNHRADGKKSMSPEAAASLADLQAVRDDVTGTSETLVRMRFYALLYGAPARSRAELKQSLNTLEYNCERMITAMQAIEGIEAEVEEPAALVSLYPRTMLGEADHKPNGREFMEVANSLAAAVPAETAWRGAARPHTLYSTTTGRLLGLNLWDKGVIKSPLVLLLGQPGSGKTTQAARLINDALATIPDLRVCAADNGGSLAPHAAVVGARYLLFDLNEPRGFNSFDYPGLGQGAVASAEDQAMITDDALLLTGTKADDAEARDVVAKAVKEVVINAARRNGPGRPKVEPTLSHLQAMLDSYEYGNGRLNDRARALALNLDKYVGNPFLDAPTHPDFLGDSPYDIYELGSLESFPPDVRAALANRVATRVLRETGKLRADGTRAPALNAFIEVWKILRDYPAIRNVLAKGALQGRKENLVTLLDTQAYEHLEGLYDVTRNCGCWLIGSQSSDFSRLAHDAGLSPRAEEAVRRITNVDGEYTQWVMVIGSGRGQIVETVQCDLAPAELWTFTTNLHERDARARVAYLKPGWSPGDAIAWLAENYPRGLAAEGLIEIDESALAGA